MASLEELRGVREQRQRQLAAALLALAIQLHVPLPARRRNRLHATREEHIFLAASVPEECPHVRRAAHGV